MIKGKVMLERTDASEFYEYHNYHIVPKPKLVHIMYYLLTKEEKHMAFGGAACGTGVGVGFGAGIAIVVVIILLLIAMGIVF